VRTSSVTMGKKIPRRKPEAPRISDDSRFRIELPEYPDRISILGKIMLMPRQLMGQKGRKESAKDWVMGVLGIILHLE